MKTKLDFYYFSGTGNTLIIMNEMYSIFAFHGIRVNLKKIELGFDSNLDDDTILGFRSG